MQFTYRAADSAGRETSGREAAISREQLAAKLKSQGLIPLEIREERRLRSFLTRRLSNPERLNFTRQLAGLLEAGITLERALGIMARLAFQRETAAVISELRRLLQEGFSFSAALERFPSHFPVLYISMVRAGEAGGLLPEVLQRLAGYLEEELSLRRFVIGSLIYPAIVIIASLAAVLFYVGTVVPRFQDIFKDLGSDLPLITQFVITVGVGIRNFWFVILGGVIFGIVWFFQKRASAKGRLQLDKVKLRIPMIGEIMRKIATARLAMALSLLNGSGVPLLSALNITARLTENAVLANALLRTEEEVRRGSPLAVAMAAQKVFPVLAVEMIGVGEESGKLSTMLDQTARGFEAETRHAIGIFLAVFQPVLIVFLVGVIAILAMAILLPVIQINSQLSGY